MFMVSGSGVIWAARGRRDDKSRDAEVSIPDTIPEALLQDQKTETSVS